MYSFVKKWKERKKELSFNKVHTQKKKNSIATAAFIYLSYASYAHIDLYQ